MKHLERAYIGNNAGIRYVIVSIILLIALSILSLGCIYLLTFIYPNTFIIGETTFNRLFEVADKSLILVLLLLPFSLSLLFFKGLIKLFHQRSLTCLINGREKIRWNRIFTGFLAWLIMVIAITVIDYAIQPDNFNLKFNLYKFIPLFIISLLLIPFQAMFEEIVFRGYIMQGIATHTGSRWIAILISSLLFTLLHMNNPEVDKYGLVMFLNYFAMALVWAIITVLDDGAEIAVGMHTANNLFISLFTTEKGSAFETDAVFEVGKSDPYLALFVLILSSLLVTSFLYKKYNWNVKILNKKVENQVDKTTGVR